LFSRELSTGIWRSFWFIPNFFYTRKARLINGSGIITSSGRGKVFDSVLIQVARGFHCIVKEALFLGCPPFKAAHLEGSPGSQLPPLFQPLCSPTLL
jgi:hypothetical protein